MKIWLDDIREPPDKSWTWCSTVVSVKIQYQTMGEKITELDIDHDLGENQPTGYDLIKWLERGTMKKGYSFPKIRVHSANPVGRKNIERAVKRIEEYLERDKE